MVENDITVSCPETAGLGKFCASAALPGAGTPPAETSISTGAAQAPRRQIAVAVEGEDVLLASRAATNLALVVNELVQNALDHAFPGRTEGQVTITLARAPGELLLAVADDGVGMAEGARPGLGTEIVHTLVREELRGQLTTTTEEGGTEIRLRLPYSD